tara:strand:- start:184 stop:570 length:387 start_codon:yes stop_codon:yes gene_type:complete
MLSGFPIIKLSKEFKMYQYFISGGPFMLPMLMGLVLSIFIAYKNIFSQYHTDKIIIIGAATSLLGIVSTVVGMNDALEFSKNMSKIAPHIMINGIKTSLITTYFGGFILLVSVLLWYYFKNKYNSQHI